MGEQSFISINSKDRPAFHPNSQAPTLPPKSFTLYAPPRTDVYATPSPPSPRLELSAPLTVRPLAKNEFLKAAVTVSLKPILPYDQGGLIFMIPNESNPRPNAANSTTQATHPEWIKCGIELNEGLPCVSVVGRERGGWADWSLWPVLLPFTTTTQIGMGEQDVEAVEVTIEMVRYKHNLKILRVMDGGRTVLVREILWVFLNRGDGDNDNETVMVGVYGCRPDPEEKAGHFDEQRRPLEVSFKDFEIVAKS